MTRSSIVVVAVLFVCSCSMPVRHYLEKPPVAGHAADSAAVDSSAAAVADSVTNDDAAFPPSPAVLEIESWPGERFIVREKPALYCAYGYDLYTCPRLDTCRGAIDTAVETKQHRVRCTGFAGTVLTVVSVEPRGKEWLVTLRSDATGKTYYAKTVAGEVPELAFVKDFDDAKKRWLNGTVYSARGFIFTIDNGTIATVKVRIQDPLSVHDLRFGTTPLPAKPFWLMVETRAGRKGAIPLYYSWTNVKKALRHEGNAWDDDIYESDPGVLCRADTATWETINMHHVRQGMTREQVRMSWGRPLEQKRGDYLGEDRECWVYENQRLWFGEKELLGIEEAAGGRR